MYVDVVIVGGGTAGTVSALTLARRGMSTLILEREPGPVWRIGEGLPPEARPVLQSLGVWEEFRSQNHLPSHGNRSVWGGPEVTETDFLFNPFGHGWHLDRHEFQALLLRHAAAAGTLIQFGARAFSTSFEADYIKVSASLGRDQLNLSCRMVLDCSGRAAVVALSNGSRRERVDQLSCVFAKCRPAAPGDSDSTTLVEAIADGWWYTVRLPSGERLFAYLSDGDLLKTFGVASEPEFTKRLRETSVVGRIYTGFGYETVEPPKTVPAFTARLDSVFGNWWVAAGDTAISFDPLSSQGLLWALRGGIWAGQAVLAALGGKTTAFADYASALNEQFEVYLRTRSLVYATEKRWRGREFWKRRI